MDFNDYINLFIWLLIVGNAFAVIVGLVMVLLPDKLPQITAITDRWISTRKAMLPLETMIESDQYSLKHPRIFGAVILLAALVILVKASLFVSNYNASEGGRLLASLFKTSGWQPAVWEVVWLTAISFIYIGAVLALFVGFTAFFKKAWLLEVSSKANRWISSRKQMKPMEVPRKELDDYIRAKPRLWGGIIVVAGLFVLVVMIWFVNP